MKEEWKDIPGFEGSYQISNYGRLKSFKSQKEGVILSNKNKTGWYLSVVLVNGSTRKSFKIHSLVVECFLGIKSTRKILIHHIDGNKQNNNLDNLSVVAARTHSLITVKEKPDFVKPMNKYNREIRPIPVLQFDLDGGFVAEYRNGKEAASATGVCGRNIMQVANKTEYRPGLIRKQAGGFIWKLKKQQDVA